MFQKFFLHFGWRKTRRRGGWTFLSYYRAGRELFLYPMFTRLKIKFI